MELISEEELSVCRSEGSPPRKNKKRRKDEGNQNTAVVDMNNPQATSVHKFGGGKAATGGATATHGKGASVLP